MEARMWNQSTTQRMYRRSLPGGGFVAIDVTCVASLFRRTQYHGVVIAERRAGPRPASHSPPVVARAFGSSAESVVRQLLPTAQYNPALGAALLTYQQTQIQSPIISPIRYE